MATFKKLPSGNFNVIIRIKGHKTVSKTFPSNQLAVEFAKVEEERIKTELTGQTFQGLSYTLKTYQERVLVNHDGSLRGSYKYTGYLGNTLLRYFGDCKLEYIRPSHVASYREYRLRECKVSESTARKEMELLQRLYRFASIELDIEIPNPVDRVAKPSGAKVRERVISYHELEHILDEVPHQYHNYLRLLMETACRRSELLKLPSSWIDLQSRVIRLPAEITKTNTSREVPLSKKAVDILKPLLANNPKVLFNWRGQALSQVFRRSCRRLGYDDVVIHTLRHSCLSRYGRMGLSVFQLSKISGHKSVKMLQRYVKIDAQSVIDAMDLA
jgi:integrase